MFPVILKGSRQKKTAYFIYLWKGGRDRKQMWKFWPTKKGLKQCIWTKKNTFLFKTNFWSIVSDDHRSKKIYRHEMIIWSPVLYSSQMILFCESYHKGKRGVGDFLISKFAKL